jgi:hypothetical protein
MRRLLLLFTSLGSAGALQNARTELELTHGRRVQAAVLAQRVGTIDAVAAKADLVAERQVPAVPTAA